MALVPSVLRKLLQAGATLADFFDLDTARTSLLTRGAALVGLRKIIVKRARCRPAPWGITLDLG